MEVRRRFPPRRPSPEDPSTASSNQIQASDALPLPIRHTNLLFSFLFVASLFFLMRRWNEKIRSSTPLHVVDLAELLSIVSLISSLIYLISFFGIAFVQAIISSPQDDDFLPSPAATCPLLIPEQNSAPEKNSALSDDDEEIISSLVAGKIPSYILESKLGDCRRAAGIRREALKRTTGRGLEGLPVDGFDYDSILGQCCELPVGYVQIPVGIAGPLRLDGREYYVPMATTEGCLVASTNRGCKAIGESGGAVSVVLRDAMTRAPVVRFTSAVRAAELKFFLEDPENFGTLSLVFNR